MNIHEYQAKALLRDYGAPVSDGRAVTRPEDARNAAAALDGPLWVVKAQAAAARAHSKSSRPARRAVSG